MEMETLLFIIGNIMCHPFSIQSEDLLSVYAGILRHDLGNSIIWFDVFHAKNIYLFLVNDVTGYEEFENSEESWVESDEADDGDEDCPDCLHLVCQDGSRDSKTKNQQVDDLKLIKSTQDGDDFFCYPDWVNSDLIHSSLVDHNHPVLVLVGPTVDCWLYTEYFLAHETQLWGPRWSSLASWDLLEDWFCKAKGSDLFTKLGRLCSSPFFSSVDTDMQVTKTRILARKED